MHLIAIVLSCRCWSATSGWAIGRSHPGAEAGTSLRYPPTSVLRDVRPDLAYGATSPTRVLHDVRYYAEAGTDLGRMWATRRVLQRADRSRTSLVLPTLCSYQPAIYAPTLALREVRHAANVAHNSVQTGAVNTLASGASCEETRQAAGACVQCPLSPYALSGTGLRVFCYEHRLAAYAVCDELVGCWDFRGEERGGDSGYDPLSPYALPGTDLACGLLSPYAACGTALCVGCPRSLRARYAMFGTDAQRRVLAADAMRAVLR
eukprot:2684909-Rhodomonas_salina.2